MTLHGILIARNEGDIIGPVLRRLLALRCYTRICLFDNGSDDDTLQVAEALADDVLQVARCDETYSDALKYRLIESHLAPELSEGDWVHVLDADEILVDDPLQRAREAEAAGCNAVEHAYAQFYLTPGENPATFDPSKPPEAQITHYLVNYGEPRLFRYDREHVLSEACVKGRDPRLILYDRHVLIQHFQFRSRPQIERRIRLRIENNRHSGNWGHVVAAEWREYVVPASYLHRYDGSPLLYGLPPGTDLFTVRNNAAYSTTTLEWMRRKGHLGPEHERYFTSHRLERRLRSLDPRAWWR